jgi:hypothetical protein
MIASATLGMAAESIDLSDRSSVLRQVTEYTTMAGTSLEPALSSTVSSIPGVAPDAPGDGMAQVTSVSQLTDVKPTDWAFQALQSLVERYGCLAGYPDQTYRGNRAMTRFEFAAGLNACLDRINQQIVATMADFISQEDLASLKRLQEEFAAELASLRGRVDRLEVSTATLESQQFSTTTKLAGEAVFALAGVAAGNEIDGVSFGRQTILSDRLRLELSTSFTGQDLLFTRLATGNTPPLLPATPLEGVLSFEQDEANDLGLEVLLYQFPIGERTEVTIGAAGMATDDFAPTLNALDGDGGSGAVSLFGTRNPIFSSTNPEGAGVAVKHQFSDQLEISLGYLAAAANLPTAGNGLFSGPYGVLGQLTWRPSARLGIGLTYANGYNVDSTVGSDRANLRSFIQDTLLLEGPPISTNAIGLTFSWQASEQFVLGGWATYANNQIRKGPFDGDYQDIWTWAVTLAFPDVIKPGNLAGLVVGMEPQVTASNNSLLKDPDLSLHIEGFFQFQLNDYVAITPGLIWLTAPGSNANNPDTVIGVIRTTFAF